MESRKSTSVIEQEEVFRENIDEVSESDSWENISDEDCELDGWDINPCGEPELVRLNINPDRESEEEHWLNFDEEQSEESDYWGSDYYEESEMGTCYSDEVEEEEDMDEGSEDSELYAETGPETLLRLSAQVYFPRSNNILHYFVLKNSDPETCANENYLGGMLRLLSTVVLANGSNEDGHSALHLAVLKRNRLMVEKLLSSFDGIDVNMRAGNGDAPLHSAVKLNDLEIIDTLVLYRANVNESSYGSGLTPLKLAIADGNISLMKKLISFGADTETCLNYAIRKNNLVCVEELLNLGANANGSSATLYSPLQEAAFQGHLAIVEILLKNKCNVHQKDRKRVTALHCAAEKGHSEVVRTLILNGADVNAKDLNKNTPLHYAVKEGNLDVVKILLMHNCDVNVQGLSLNTVLHLAAKTGNFEIFKALQLGGAKLNLKNSYGQTPLHLAARQGGEDIVKILLENMCSAPKSKYNLRSRSKKCHADASLCYVDINAKTLHDRTPLHYAVMKENRTVVEMLVQYGCDRKITDLNGRTAQYYAKKIEAKKRKLATVKQNEPILKSDDEASSLLPKARLKEFRSLFAKLLQDVHAQSVPILRLKEFLADQHLTHPFTTEEFDAALDAMTEANQILTANGIAFLI